MNKQIIPIVSRKQIHKTDPHSPLLKPAPTDLYAEIRGGNKNTNNKDFMDSQYIEVKSEKILKIYVFHRYILKYPQKQDEYHT